MNIHISAVRAEDPISDEWVQPHRRNCPNPSHERAECLLGRMRLRGTITEAEYQAGCRWRSIYDTWLRSIGAPGYEDQDLDDELCEAIAKAMRTGEAVLKKLGPRVFHAVNAIAVYEEAEELGDFELTSEAAKVGLAALAEVFC